VAPVTPVAPVELKAKPCTKAALLVRPKLTLLLFANNVNNCCAEFNTGVFEVTLYKPGVLPTDTFAICVSLF
jgi:hypothetical protein